METILLMYFLLQSINVNNITNSDTGYISRDEVILSFFSQRQQFLPTFFFITLVCILHLHYSTSGVNFIFFTLQAMYLT